VCKNATGGLVSWFFLVIQQHPALPDYQTYEYYVKNWLCLVNQKHPAQPCSTIHKQKDSYDTVLFSEPKTYDATLYPIFQN